MIATRHSKETGIFIKNYQHGWRHIDCNDAGRQADVGPLYKTKQELLADHEDYLRRAGWMKD